MPIENTNTTTGRTILNWLEGVAVVVGTIVAFVFGYFQMQMNSRMANQNKEEIGLVRQENLISSLQFATQATSLLQGDVLDGSVPTSETAPNSYEEWEKRPTVLKSETDKPKDAFELLKKPEDKRKKFRLRPQAVALGMLVTVAEQQASISQDTDASSIHTAASDKAHNVSVDSTIQLIRPLLRSPDPSAAAGALLAITELLQTHRDSFPKLSFSESADVNLSYVLMEGVKANQLNNISLPRLNFRFGVFPDQIEMEKFQAIGAKLDGAYLANLVLKECDFSEAVGIDVNMSHTIFENCKFLSTKKRVAFSNIKLDHVKIAGGSFVGDFKKCLLKKAEFSDVVLAGSIFNGAKANDSPLEDIKLCELATKSDNACMFMGTKMDMRNVKFNDNSDLSRAFFGKDVNLLGASFLKAKLLGACFDGVNVQKTSDLEKTYPSILFQGADLRKASFAGAQLKNANFSESDLSMASFVKADLHGANFVNAKFNRKPKADPTQKPTVDQKDEVETNWAGANLQSCLFSPNSDSITIDFATNDTKCSDTFNDCKDFSSNSHDGIYIVAKSENGSLVYMGYIIDNRNRDGGLTFKYGYNDNDSTSIQTSDSDKDTAIAKLTSEKGVVFNKEEADKLKATFIAANKPAAP